MSLKENSYFGILIIGFLIFNFSACDFASETSHSHSNNSTSTKFEGIELVVLGTVQDAGAPHIGCQKKCCQKLWAHPDPKLKVVSLGLIDHAAKKSWLFDASPDLPSQIQYLNEQVDSVDNNLISGIFLTHAHIGHYTGLMYLGREAIHSKSIPVYCMPEMEKYLSTNGPWSQLVELNNIALVGLKNEGKISISKNIKVKPILVPHRDEYSETVGYAIYIGDRKILYIPDIDKWHQWDKDILEEIKTAHLAFLDATFYANNEVKGRNMSEIPHPFVLESMAHFEHLTAEDKKKIHFIHFNHTNPLLDDNSVEFQNVYTQGFSVAQFGQKFLFEE